MPIGPFQVTGEQIERLASSFVQVINELLTLEARDAGMRGHQLRLDTRETADGGVDAEVLDASPTDWIPPGDSAWQFKSWNPGPADCATEFEKARWVRELVAGGAAYRLAVASRLTPLQVERRRKAILAEIAHQGIGTDAAKIQVLDGNAIARWATEFPSLAVNPLLGGPGYGVLTFDQWSSRRRHAFIWVEPPERTELIARIQADLADETKHEIRLQGQSGFGKTRVILEALRSDQWRSLVAYVPEADKAPTETLAFLLSGARSVVLVVDECDAHQHDVIAQLMPTEGEARLVTIGRPSTAVPQVPVISVGSLGDAIEALLEQNFPEVWAEARRFVAQHAAGNARYAILLAQKVRDTDARQAAAIIERDDVRQFFPELEGEDAFLASTLALFERVGWDAELRPQMEAVAKFVGLSVDDVERQGLRLESSGVLLRHGRYRSIEPHPLAVSLAAETWHAQSGRIVNALIPDAGRELNLSLFSRAADLGAYEPARRVLVSLMAPDGPFGSLETMEDHDLGPFLRELAVVAPEETANHLESLIASAQGDALSNQRRSRRDLVWALEKLAWHRATFDQAADSLLKLAMAENETYGNNATGTWVALFGTVLPATAALPSERLGYLQRVSQSTFPKSRELALQACQHGLQRSETVMVSAENQRGALVETRGGARTPAEAATYRLGLLGIAEELTLDSEPSVSAAAVTALLRSLMQLIDDPVIRPQYLAILLRLEGDAAERLWREVQHLETMASRSKRDAFAELVADLAQRVPEPSPDRELQLLLETDPWVMDADTVRARLISLLTGTSGQELFEDALSLSRRTPLRNGWVLGEALFQISPDLTRDTLVGIAEVNPSTVAAFLRGATQDGDRFAFDHLLDSPGLALPARTILELTIRGPVSRSARIRVQSIIRALPVAEAARAMFGWRHATSARDLVRILRNWLPRLEGQTDYNAAVDWTSAWLHDHRRIQIELRAVLLELLRRRVDYGQLGNERWDWARIAERLLTRDPAGIAGLVISVMNDGSQVVLEEDEEARLLARAASLAPGRVWALLATNLGKDGWRLAMSIQGWLLPVLPMNVVTRWVKYSIKRARKVASLTKPTEGSLLLVEWLLVKFPNDRAITSSLLSSYVSGSWVGPWSHRITNQLSELASWRNDERWQPELREWAARAAAALEHDLRGALQEEAEHP